MFFLKQLVGALIMPMPIILFLLGVGVVLLWFANRRQGLGKALVTIGALLLFLASFPPLAHRLIQPIEREFPHLIDARFVDEEVRWIVVLGGGVSSDLDVQPHVRVSDEALFRVMEGVRLHRALPDTRILFSGRGGSRTLTTAQANAEVARSFGVSETAIEVDPDPRDTGEEARAAAEWIEPGERFLLVTSAAHLPRAMIHFRAEGLDPIPSPAHRYALGTPGGLRGHFPQARALRMTERTIHERAGIFWARMR